MRKRAHPFEGNEAKNNVDKVDDFRNLLPGVKEDSDGANARHLSEVDQLKQDFVASNMN
jgi:hypothetical protein